jgi:hypothetical protein
VKLDVPHPLSDWASSDDFHGSQGERNYSSNSILTDVVMDFVVRSDPKAIYEVAAV